MDLSAYHSMHSNLNHSLYVLEEKCRCMYVGIFNIKVTHIYNEIIS